MLRPFVESSEICVPLTRELCSPLSACTATGLDSTRIASATCPNFIWKSTRIRSFTSNTTPLYSSTLKPEARAFTSYLPISKLGTTYWPASCVARVRTVPVSTLVTRIATFGTTAPLGSVTVPTIVASWAVTRDGNATSTPTMKTVRLIQRCFSMRTVQTNDENEEHIVPPPTSPTIFRTPRSLFGKTESLRQPFEVKIGRAHV